MSTLAQLKRFYLIIDKLENSHFPPTMEEIHNFLEDEMYNASTRTIQRDMERLRQKFGVDVQYDTERQGYYIDHEHSVNLNNFYRFLEYANTADLLTESIMRNKEILDYIHFESQGQLKGINLLRDIMFAIKNRRKIRFAHRKFNSDQLRYFTMKPYGLKEYQGRWYVVGVIEKRDNYLKFGIDRIENMEVTNEWFETDEEFDINELFDDVIGLHANNKKQKVVLKFDPEQGEYIKTLPLHYSQKIVEDNDNGLIIELNIRPNFELVQKILMQAQSVKVLEPQWLADELRDIYQSAIKKYKKQTG
jgi:predicted DNA-binding transcriptional regulator YafY